jgi:predicted ATPase
MPHVELCPITILVGRNSSGKSTFLRALPLLKQSVATRTSAPILWYGDWVDFGDFNKAVYNNNEKERISFFFGAKNLKTQSGGFVDDLGFVQTVREVGDADIDLQIVIGKHGTGTRVELFRLTERLNNCTVEISINEDNSVRQIQIDGADAVKYTGDVTLAIGGEDIFPQMYSRPKKINSDAGIRFVRAPEMAIHQEIIKFFAGRVDGRTTVKTLQPLVWRLLQINPVNRLTLNAYAQSCSHASFRFALQTICRSGNTVDYDALRTMLLLSKIQTWIFSVTSLAKEVATSTLYIGPARAKSDRYYRYQDLSVSEIDPDGKNFPMFLNALDEQKMDEFSSWVKNLFGYGVLVKRQSGHISIELEYSAATVNIVDTGYGISQILPVLGQIWWAGRAPVMPERAKRHTSHPPKIIAIEQPELHLHPAHQALLADALVAVVGESASGNSNGRPLNFVIETHSEALINRLGELISTGALNSAAVQILIFEADDDENRTSKIKIANYDQSGALTDWPFGFFLP